MRAVYLGLAILGAVVPYTFFIGHLGAEGLDPYAFLRDMFANPAARGLSSDLLISSVVFWVWLVHSRAKRAWLFVVLNLTIGLSCALPAYLYAREREGGGSEAVV